MASAKQKTEVVTEQKQEFNLVVVHAFGAYRKGDCITGADEIETVLNGENKLSVNKVPA